MPREAAPPTSPDAAPAASLAARLAEAGLALPEGDFAKLAPMAAELATSALMIRKERSYLEEPAHTLKLWSR